MQFILILILLAIIGGPVLVAAALALTGIWFAIVWTITGIVLAVSLGAVIVFMLTSFGISLLGKKPKRSFTIGLDPRFKEEHEFEHGIYEEDGLYIVELSGQPNYFWKLADARHARDNGTAYVAEVSAVPKDHPSKRPFNRH